LARKAKEEVCTPESVDYALYELLEEILAHLRDIKAALRI